VVGGDRAAGQGSAGLIGGGGYRAIEARNSTGRTKERAKLNTVDQVNFEIRKLYRRFSNGEINSAALNRRIATLVALRSGLPETIERPKAPELPIINIRTAAEGQQFAPGNEVLMPFDVAAKAWQAYNAGKEAWQAYLAAIEGQLTRAAFDNLCRVEPLERETLVLHDLARPRLVSFDDDHVA
jgi:hypothetical protein